jgi:NitT/TauT family transport system substrate-binding protein
MRTTPGVRWTAVAVGLLAPLLAAGCSRSGSDPPTPRGTGTELVTVAYIGVREQGGSGYAAAELEGFFAQQGLKLSPTWATSGSVMLQGLVSGTFNVSNLGPAQVYEAIGNGACARVLRPTEGAAYGLISRPDLHLNTTLPYPQVLEQRKGKAIGVAARGAAQELVLRSLLKDAGLDPEKDVRFVAIGGGDTATTAFATGKVDVAMSYSLLEVTLQAEGTSFDKLLNLSGSDTPLGTFWQAMAVANCDWADSHHDTVMRFCHALNLGFDALAHDPATGPKAFAYVNLGSDLAQATSLWAKYKGPLIDIPPLNEDTWNHQARFTRDGYTPELSKYVVSGCATA